MIITDIFKDSIKNIKKHLKSIIIIFLIILLVYWINYKYNNKEHFDTYNDKYNYFKDKYNTSLDDCLTTIQRYKDEENIEMMICMYIPDIEITPGLIVEIPIYTISEYRLGSFMFRLLELPSLFSNYRFETNLMDNDVKIINGYNNYFVSDILTFNILNDVSKESVKDKPQLFGYLVLTISSNIDNNKFKNLRDCDIIVWAEYAANANKKLVNITPIVSGTNTLDNPNNYPTISNKLSIYSYNIFFSNSISSTLLDDINTLDWNSPDTMNKLILNIDNYGNRIPTKPITTQPKATQQISKPIDPITILVNNDTDQYDSLITQYGDDLKNFLSSCLA